MHPILRTAAIAAIALTLPASAFALDDAGAAPAAPPAAAAAEPEWFADFDKAVEAAKAQKKDLLVDFTGSDWCGWCIKLHEEVFAKGEFKAGAPKDFILVALDFPNGAAAKAKVPNAQRNQELAQKYKIAGFPTILVMTADGDVLGRTGYAEGGPVKYVESLSKIRSEGREALVVVAKLEKELAAATGDARVPLIEKAAEALAKSGEGPAARLATAVREGMKLDPENKSGLKLKCLKAIFAAGTAEAADREAAAALDPKNEAGLLEQSLLARMQEVMQSGDGFDAFVADALALAKTGNLKNEEVYLAVLANAAGMGMQFGMEGQAREIAGILKEKGPKGNARLDAFLEQILSAKPGAKPAGGDGEGDDDDDDDDDHEGHEHEKK